ncbi:hypothetical protein PM082_009614 [Marasmius tenuissimus]|nr:hypothetical protein PM082_009614 [Marasmius tenuissimus]
MSEIIAYMESLREDGRYTFPADIEKTFNKTSTIVGLQRQYQEEKDGGEFDPKLLSQICWLMVEDKEDSDKRSKHAMKYPKLYLRDIGRVDGSGLLFFPDYFVAKAWRSCEFVRVEYGNHDIHPVILFREDDYDEHYCDGPTNYLYYSDQQFHAFASTISAIAFHRESFMTRVIDNDFQVPLNSLGAVGQKVNQIGEGGNTPEDSVYRVRTWFTAVGFPSVCEFQLQPCDRCEVKKKVCWVNVQDEYGPCHMCQGSTRRVAEECAGYKIEDFGLNVMDRDNKEEKFDPEVAAYKHFKKERRLA